MVQVMSRFAKHLDRTELDSAINYYLDDDWDDDDDYNNEWED